MLRSLRPLLGAILFSTAPLAALAQTSWTPRHQASGSGSFLWSIVEGSAGIVAVGTNGRILHSVDGRTWTTRISGTTNWLVAVTYGNGRYVAVGDNGTILTSIDASTWVRATSSGTTARLNNVAFGYDRYVAVGERSTVITSFDGMNWEPVALDEKPFSGWLRGLAYARVDESNTWVATGQDGTRIVSYNGTIWHTYYGTSLAGGVEDLEAVVCIGRNALPTARFVAVGSHGSTAILSAGIFNDGAIVTDRESLTGTTARLRSLTYGNGVLIATGENGTVISAPSATGPWKQVNVGTTKNLVGAGFVQGTLMLVGEDETILQSEPIYTSRLGNISTRGIAGTGGASMIAGTVIQGTRPKTVLIRGIGPALGQFGVSNVLSNPVLSVFDSSNKLIGSNAGWSTSLNVPNITSTTAAAGAFALAIGSNDSALLLTLNPGSYTFQLAAASGAGGNALIEAYDVDPLDDTRSRTINISTRGQVGSGEGILVAGLVVQGPSSRTLLIRGVGPTLGQFGVANTLADPVIRVVARNGTVIAANDNWTDAASINGRDITAEELQVTARACGAFPLAAGSKDAALLITLVPGNYTIQVSGANNTTGVALVEAYDVPNN